MSILSTYIITVHNLIWILQSDQSGELKLTYKMEKKDLAVVRKGERKK